MAKGQKQPPAEAQTPAEAWQRLCEVGGLEPEGRDENMIELLRQKLDPVATTLEAALNGAGMAHFLHSFFDCITPYAAMLNALLEYFAAAGAKVGSNELRISLKDLDGNELSKTLNHFREWSKRCHEALATTMVHIPQPAEAWSLHGAVNLPIAAPVIADIQDWLRRFDAGEWPELPPCPSGIPELDGVASEVWRTLQAVLGAMRRTAPKRGTLWQFNRYGDPIADDAAATESLSPPSLGRIDHDRWAATLLTSLYFAYQRPQAEQLASGTAKRFREALARMPRKPVATTIQMRDLEAILSLPMWRFRHALFSSWIHTEMIHAIGIEHFDLFSDKGALKFGFGEFKMARFRDRFQPLDFMSERRTPGTGLIGDSRKGNIQPDYTVWPEGVTAAEDCLLGVECKQYERQSKKNFRAALIDYSRTLVNATVVLAAYGPAKQTILDEVPEEYRGRCRIVDRLEPINLGQVEAFRKLVRDALLPPVVAGQPVSGLKAAVVVDVSRSMADSLSGRGIASRIMELAGQVGATHVITADTEIRECVEATKSAVEGLLGNGAHGKSTDIGAALARLPLSPDKVIVLTDESGKKTLGELGKKFMHVEVVS